MPNNKAVEPKVEDSFGFPDLETYTYIKRRATNEQTGRYTEVVTLTFIIFSRKNM